jgi:tRNA_anti-like
MNRAILALLIAVLGFAASGCSATGDGSDSDQAPGKPDVKVEAKQILKEFENNEAAADGKYKNKTLQVSGVVDKVDTEIFDDEKYVVRVGAGTQFAFTTVNCNGQSSKDVAKIKKGQKITVVGGFDDGGDLGVELKPCRVK